MSAPLEAYTTAIHMGQAGVANNSYSMVSIGWWNLDTQVDKMYCVLDGNGGYQNLNSALSDDLETTLTVISHPLPESEAEKLLD